MVVFLEEAGLVAVEPLALLDEVDLQGLGERVRVRVDVLDQAGGGVGDSDVVGVQQPNLLVHVDADLQLNVDDLLYKGGTVPTLVSRKPTMPLTSCSSFSLIQAERDLMGSVRCGGWTLGLKSSSSSF